MRHVGLKGHVSSRQRSCADVFQVESDVADAHMNRPRRDFLRHDYFGRYLVMAPGRGGYAQAGYQQYGPQPLWHSAKKLQNLQFRLHSGILPALSDEPF